MMSEAYDERLNRKLADTIRLYWAKRGVKMEVSAICREYKTRNGKTYSLWGIRSNIGMYMPVGAKRAAA